MIVSWLMRTIRFRVLQKLRGGEDSNWENMKKKKKSTRALVSHFEQLMEMSVDKFLLLLSSFVYTYICK